MTAAAVAQPVMEQVGPANLARSIPSSWRILLLALVFGAMVQASAITLPLLAALGIFGVWRTLAPMSSSQVVEPRSGNEGGKAGWLPSSPRFRRFLRS